MELGGYGFEKPELLKLAEQIYECKGKKQDLELELSSAKFHEKYLPQRKEIAERSAMSHLVCIVPLTILVLVAIAYFAFYIIFANKYALRENAFAGLAMLAGALIILFVGRVDIMLIRQASRFFLLLYSTKNPARAERFDQKFNINALQNDEDKTKERIRMLTEEINSLDARIVELSNRQELLLKEKEERENVLREKGILFDEKPDVEQKDGKFSLKMEDAYAVDIREMYEFYSKEEQYIRHYQSQLDVKLQQINREIVAIDENFETVKKQFLFFIIIYVMVAVIQSAFSGLLSAITSIVCLVVGAICIVQFERRWKSPIILYLIEHDSKLTQEYAFCNSMVPVGVKREEVLRLIEYYNMEMQEIKEKKELLDL